MWATSRIADQIRKTSFFIMLGGYSSGVGVGEGIWHPVHFCLAFGFLEHLLLFLPSLLATVSRAVFLEDARNEMP